MKQRLILSTAFTLVLLGILAVLLTPKGREQAKIDREQEELVPLAEERVLEVQPNPVSRPALRGLSYEEQLAVLSAEGWSSKEAKIYAFGRLLHDGMLRAEENDEENYWKPPDYKSVDWEQRRKRGEDQRLLKEILGDLVGKPGLSFYGPRIPVPEEKRKALTLMEANYSLMKAKLNSEFRGVLFPEDKDARVLLEQSRRRDIEALLSPEELFEYDLRKSDIAQTLRGQLSAFEPTEEEFREIFRIEQGRNRLSENHSARSVEELARRQREQNEVMKTEFRELLGERYQLYERSQDWSYERLIAVTERLDIPRERVDAVYDLKDFLESEKGELRENPELSDEAQDEAVRELEEEVREGLTELLGERGLEVYRDNGGNWLQQMQGFPE